MNAETSRMSLRELTARRSYRARQILYGASNEANAKRIMKVLKGRAGRPGYFAARHAADRLPGMIRAEASAARELASDCDSRTDESAVMYVNAIERATILERWAETSEFPSVKNDALVLVRKMLVEQSP